jgi:restriction system protein
MPTEQAIWGNHTAIDVGTDPVDMGYAAVGWHEMGDLSAIPPDREAFKRKYEQTYGESRPRRVSVSAGQTYRFLHELAVGDVIVFPCKADRRIHIGRVSGEYQYCPDQSVIYPNRRPVSWLASVQREAFSQEALYEAGSFLTLFKISNYAEEFLAALSGSPPAISRDDDESREVAASLAEQFEESTEDFVIRRLKSAQTPYEFEHFVAHLLQCMGYHARVTKASGDGGVDVIAHRDELGFEPPLIKVQCKQSLTTHGRPDVQKLYGAIEKDEKGLFVTLGSFSADARTFEQTKSNLRLLDGKELVELIFAHYDRFAPRYRALVPLKRTYSPGL